MVASLRVPRARSQVLGDGPARDPSANALRQVIGAACASKSGGITEARRRSPDRARRSREAPAAGNIDDSSPSAPETNGAAKLVPARATGGPWVARLMMASPGAPRPHLPVDRPKFD